MLGVEARLWQFNVINMASKSAFLLMKWFNMMMRCDIKCICNANGQWSIVMPMATHRHVWAVKFVVGQWPMANGHWSCFVAVLPCCRLQVAG